MNKLNEKQLRSSYLCQALRGPEHVKQRSEGLSF